MYYITYMTTIHVYLSGGTTEDIITSSRVGTGVVAGGTRVPKSGGNIIVPLIISKYGGIILLLKRKKE